MTLIIMWMDAYRIQLRNQDIQRSSQRYLKNRDGGYSQSPLCFPGFLGQLKDKQLDLHPARGFSSLEGNGTCMVILRVNTLQQHPIQPHKRDLILHNLKTNYTVAYVSFKVFLRNKRPEKSQSYAKYHGVEAINQVLL